jgi:hypothetical protein
MADYHKDLGSAPLIFIMFINDLRSNELLHKYIDDLTVTEIFAIEEGSKMHSVLSEIQQWSVSNLLNINIDKTKEMLVCSANRVCVERLKINDIIIQCVPSFKLLGVSIDCNLKWNSHVESICSKANCRIYFLKHLKRSGVELEDLLLFYYTAIRSILEYACPAWHTSITSEQSDRIETIQKRALSIIFNFSVFENYGNFCAHNGIESLAKRRDDLCRKFFDRNVLNDFSCLHYLLPTSKDECITNKLRNRPKYNNLTARTARFMNSLIMYGLSNYL